MLTEKTFKEFQKLCHYGLKCQVSAILWNLGEVNTRNRVLYFSVFYIGLIYYSIDVCYLTFTFFNLSLRGTTPFGVLFKAGYHWFLRAGGIIFQYHQILSKSQLQAYITQLFNFHYRLQRTHHPVSAKRTRFGTIDAFFHAYQLALKSFNVLCALNLFADPNAPQYWHVRFCPSDPCLSFLFKIPFLLIEWYMTANGSFAFALYTFILIIHTDFITSWLRVFCKTRPRSQTPHFYGEIKVIYQEFHVLKRIHGSIFRNILPLASVLFFMIHCATNYILIRFRNTATPPHYLFAVFTGSLLAFGFTYILLKSGDKMREYSFELKRLTNSASRNRLRREIHACPVLNYEIGPIKLKKTSFGTYYSTLIECLTQALLYSRTT